MSGNLEVLLDTLRANMTAEGKENASFTLTDAAVDASVAFYRVALPRMRQGLMDASKAGNHDAFNAAIKDVSHLAASMLFGSLATAMAGNVDGDEAYAIQSVINMAATVVAIDSTHAAETTVVMDVPVRADGE